MTADVVDTLARTLWGEARGEGIAGMQAVASVILNRRIKGGWWGNSIVEICKKPYQFSCWLENDPNHNKLLAVNDHDISFAQALLIAKDAVAGTLADSVNGATSYKTTVLPWPRAWGTPKDPVKIIGHHSFYKL